MTQRSGQETTTNRSVTFTLPQQLDQQTKTDLINLIASLQSILTGMGPDGQTAGQIQWAAMGGVNQGGRFASTPDLAWYDDIHQLWAFTPDTDTPKNSLIRFGSEHANWTLNPYGTDYIEALWGADFLDEAYTARQTTLALDFLDNSGAFGQTGRFLYYNQTPDQPASFADFIGFAVGADGIGMLHTSAHPSTFICDNLSLRGDAGTNPNFYVNFQIADAITADRGIEFKTDNTDHRIRFDGVGTPVTWD